MSNANFRHQWFFALAAFTLLTTGCGPAPTPKTPEPISKVEPAPKVETPKVETPPSDSKSLVLYVSRDESELERKIGTYLSSMGLHVESRDKDGDLMLYLDYSAEDGAIEYQIMIDTWFSANDKSERLVAIRLLSGMKISNAERPEVYKAINTHHIDYWAGTFYIDSDQNVRGQWTINIPNVELPGELIKDSINRISSSWLKLHKAILQSRKAGFHPGSDGVGTSATGK